MMLSFLLDALSVVFNVKIHHGIQVTVVCGDDSSQKMTRIERKENVLLITNSENFS